ncbi:hypothetical protein TVAG_443670 [Trichomonas vaginalis G3]|uniref:Uncharacterized protein n=1 Tax=Trichomonas vaginalis (strain ATCC PRA-98 / G3) TaxID=412133 RepID=A2ETZ1_TRIV3|nr:hypothetical protein TVAGG3_0235400 [Trichomonas vaginalis G3]EAY03879.1 hypothetical protein TVAG_443670 [Trichomonas vaginalis G3]KAI5552951.1 hypothetical protein TVAGG3_0235400 [Trichomonas vaginalis G3]|eukprot:XP_001316102.1 hypothetical protein [Trichomonas vaginalis G3]
MSHIDRYTFNEDLFPVKNHCRILNEDVRKEVIKYLDEEQNFFKKKNLSKIIVEKNKIVYAINSDPNKHRHIAIIAQASKILHDNILGAKLFFMLMHAEINDPNIETYEDVVQILNIEKSVNIHPFLTFKYYYCGKFFSSALENIINHFFDNRQYDITFESNRITSGYFFNIYVDSFFGFYSSVRSHILGIRLPNTDDSEVQFTE